MSFLKNLFLSQSIPHNPMLTDLNQKNELSTEYFYWLFENLNK